MVKLDGNLALQLGHFLASKEIAHPGYIRIGDIYLCFSLFHLSEVVIIKPDLAEGSVHNSIGFIISVHFVPP